MERTVPSTASEEVELYLRTYYSLLRSTAEVQIRTLEEAHAGMNSLLHPAARDPKPDMSAFLYSILRLPDCMPAVRLVVLGQSIEVLKRAGYEDVSAWGQVSAPVRRRRCYFDGKDTLACLVASRSDIDDIIPMLTAYQIEWNKLHRLLHSDVLSLAENAETDREARQRLADRMEISIEDLERLSAVWGANFAANLQQIADSSSHISVRLLSGSYNEYRRATHAWWENIERACTQLRSRPVYFVSSNTHSLANLVSGYAFEKRGELLQYLERSGNPQLLGEWKDIQERQVPSSQENFLYYLLKKYQGSSEGKNSLEEQLAHERAQGIVRIPSENYFDVEAQVVELSCIDCSCLDPRLQQDGLECLRDSPALILNIDYPLGLAAYNILTEVAENVGSVLGVYVMGKAATLNGVGGDVMICNVVHDEQSQNTYLFPNCFTAADVSPYLVFGAVLDNQKAVTVQGTFLQNAHYMDVFYREGYTDIEMEAGPYLSAVYEMYRPKRHPVNEIVNLYGVPFDLGIIHYASDKPLYKGKNLGAGSMSYFGMDSTYAATLAILKRIFAMEKARQS
jgi:hypothetical protein